MISVRIKSGRVAAAEHPIAKIKLRRIFYNAPNAFKAAQSAWSPSDRANFPTWVGSLMTGTLQSEFIRPLEKSDRLSG